MTEFFYGKDRGRMIVLISGASHTGKTMMAQKILEKYHFSYLSLDHLKMGLIRSGQTKISIEDDEAMTGYLWPIVCEIIKTAIENQQNLTIEGIYIPHDWQNYFSEKERSFIRYQWIIMCEKYICDCFNEVKDYANTIEHRQDEHYWTKERALEKNKQQMKKCHEYQLSYYLIDSKYDIDLLLQSFKIEE